nr:HopAT1p_1 [Pseudomonas syringae]
MFARDAGDIDLKDVVHNDRILVVLIPALEISSSEAATLGRLYVSQMAMILSQDLGEKLEGKPEDILVIRKYKDRFPFLWICDEVGAYYTEKLGELATQVRSPGVLPAPGQPGGAAPQVGSRRQGVDADREHGCADHRENHGPQGHPGNTAADGRYRVLAGNERHGAPGGHDGR